MEVDENAGKGFGKALVFSRCGQMTNERSPFNRRLGLLVLKIYHQSTAPPLPLVDW